MQILRIVVCTAYSKINLNGKWRVRAIFKDSCLSTCKYTCNGVRANPTALSGVMENMKKIAYNNQPVGGDV